MTDLTEHLGELMGQSAEEQAADAAWVEAAELAMGETQSPIEPDILAETAPAAEIGADGAVALVETPEIDVSAIDPAAAPQTADTAAANGFPFEAAELIGLLPHSVAGRAGEMWRMAGNLSAESDTFLVALVGIALGFVVVAFASTVRVWRRQEEFAVSGFGDALTTPGAKYSVRQDVPVAVAAGTSSAHTAAEPTQDNSTEPETKSVEDRPAKTAASAEKGPRRVRRQLTAKTMRSEPASVQVARRSTPNQDQSQSTAAKSERSSFRSKPLGGRMIGRDAAKGETPSARNAKDRSTPVKGPIASSAPLAASFHSSFGSFHESDRVFAQDYLKQTIDAFEAGYLKGKGPRLTGRLKISDNARAERLFMLATSASTEDPQSALAALWQAVEENPEDAVAWLRLAHFYMEAGDFENAEKILLPLLDKAEADDVHLVAASAANSLGRIASHRGDVEAAHGLFTRALQHADKTGKPYIYGVVASNLGVLEAARGQNEAARDLLELGVRSFEECQETIASARTKVVLGAVYRALGDEAAANRVWGEAHATFESEGLKEEAAIVARWIAGEDPPTGVGL